VPHGEHLTRSRGFALSLAYVLGMAVTYALAGVAAGLLGTMLSAALQTPWVLGSFAALFVVLSLSMFGFYELQLPSALQSRLAVTSNRLHGGHFLSVFGMGIVSALIVGPCVAAPLAGALLYISKSGDYRLGGAALFALALGMGVPLLVVGASAGTLLPKAGAWMDTVKRFFGVVLLGVAIFLVSPLLTPMLHFLAWAALFIMFAVYLHALDPLPQGAPGYRRFFKGIGILALITGIALIVGALSGGRDVLQPLAGLRVIEFTHMVMGPTCGMVRADLGAEVIKIEPLDGDSTRQLLGSGAISGPYRKTRPLRLTLLRRLLAALNCLR
jgi:thiol:disulfide interchange protein DsbD